MRQFNSQQRWKDYIDAFVKVTKKVRELNADIFIIAGDLFHKYRPHPGIIRRFLKEISSLHCKVIIIRGNHDSPQILFDKYGGDILHLIRDVSNIVYLNRKKPTHILKNICFIGLGYISFDAPKEIKNLVESVKTTSELKIGIFHQLLDYPGIPENRSEVTRNFLRNLGLDFILTGHYHLSYSESDLFNSGSPEYWAFDQANQIYFNLDTEEEVIKNSSEKGFYMIDTDKKQSLFVKIQPARQMFCISYETNNFSESKHLSRIKDHLSKYNMENSMVKTIIRGRHKYGRLNISEKIRLEKPLIHKSTMFLHPSNSIPLKVDLIKANTEYLVERGIKSSKAHVLSQWLEQNKEKLATMNSNNLLQLIRQVLKQ
jgi:DNA repair exonuclease SbcCD nuclease subunit